MKKLRKRQRSSARSSVRSSPDPAPALTGWITEPWTPSDLLFLSLRHNRLLPPQELNALPRRKRKLAKAKWLATSGMREVRRREHNINMAFLDAWAWTQIAPHLSTHRELKPFLPTLRVLATGFGPWWWQKMEISPDAIRAVGPHLQAYGISPIELFGILQRLRFPAEHAWAQWLLEYQKKRLTRGVGRRLVHIAGRMGSLPFSKPVRDQIAIESQQAETVQLCLRLFRQHLRPAKSPTLNLTIVGLVEFLVGRKLTRHKASNVVAILLDMTPDQVRQRYIFHTRRDALAT